MEDQCSESRLEHARCHHDDQIEPPVSKVESDANLQCTMPGTFKIAVEQRRKLLRVTLSGFLSRDDVINYLSEKNAALKLLNAGPNNHLTLCDVSKCLIQSQDVALDFQETLSDPRYMSRQIAFVIGSSLARLQVQRLLSRSGAACFTTSEAAEAWLFREEDEAIHTKI